MSETTHARPQEPEADSATRVRVTISDRPADDELSPVQRRRFSPGHPAPGAPSASDGRYQPIPALSPAVDPAVGRSGPSPRKLVAAAGVAALAVGGASTLILRPRAQTPPPPAAKQAIPYTPQVAAPARTTYAVRVGPYRDSRAVLGAHKRLRGIGFEPFLIYSGGGTYLRILTTPDEPKATRIARGLQQDGFTAIVTETGPESGLLKSEDAAEPRYRSAGVRVDFEAGQSKGWEISGSAISMRNSSLFSFHGEHSLEVALRETSGTSPGILRLKPESVVLPQDRFVARILQPTAAGGRLAARFYLTDAQGINFVNVPIPLVPERWIDLQLVVSQHAVLPIQEIGLDFRSPDHPWTGAVYVDQVEQERPQ